MPPPVAGPAAYGDYEYPARGDVTARRAGRGRGPRGPSREAGRTAMAELVEMINGAQEEVAQAAT
ncbi:hypothetical protein ACWDUG_34205, partial [Streptomyces cellulosae]